MIDLYLIFLYLLLSLFYCVGFAYIGFFNIGFPDGGPQGLLCDSTVSQFSIGQDRSAGVSASRPGFFMPISTHLEPRFWGYKYLLISLFYCVGFTYIGFSDAGYSNAGKADTDCGCS